MEDKYLLLRFRNLQTELEKQLTKWFWGRILIAFIAHDLVLLLALIYI